LGSCSDLRAIVFASSPYYEHGLLNALLEFTVIATCLQIGYASGCLSCVIREVAGDHSSLNGLSGHPATPVTPATPVFGVFPPRITIWSLAARSAIIAAPREDVGRHETRLLAPSIFRTG
jgi:hypothetical protein